jgi:hypothetical protein
MSNNGGGGGGGMIMIVLLLFMCSCSVAVSAAGGLVLWKNPDLVKKIFGEATVPGPGGVPVPAPGPGGVTPPGPAPVGAAEGSVQSPTYGGGGGGREMSEQCPGYVKSIEVSAKKKDLPPMGTRKGDKTHVTGWKVNCDDGTKKDFGITAEKPWAQECSSGFKGFNIWLGKDGKLVQAMQPICMDGKILDTHGNPDGNPKQQWYCPDGKKVVGFSGMSGSWLDSVSWTCR